ASWLMILGYEPNANAAKKQDECLRGDISLDVPRGARIGIKSKDGDLSVENVAKITIKNINGDVNLRDIANETEVTSLSSDISIENANGKIAAKTVSGDVEVYRCRPIEISDSCKISSTSGSVSMQETAHRNIEATSTSGDVSIYGALSNGGSYDFSTTSGAIALFLPANSSFQLNATMSYGASFNSEIPLKTSTQNSTQKVQQTESRQIKATCGAGDSNINLTTFNGSLRIKKTK
ncbi:MAG: DUF4097 family beta strand repeat protein, partial [Pyrinomonadaceae bacterium]|nr:DUF4097 family beta strand repeat protein [Pyrinomonadaceae bacterium]